MLAMILVALAWLYVALMMAVAEATSPQGTVLGAVLGFVGYGLLPLALVLYVMATPARKRARAAREAQENDTSARLDPDGGGHAAGAAALAPERKEP